MWNILNFGILHYLQKKLSNMLELYDSSTIAKQIGSKSAEDHIITKYVEMVLLLLCQVRDINS